MQKVVKMVGFSSVQKIRLAYPPSIELAARGVDQVEKGFSRVSEDPFGTFPVSEGLYV